MNLIQIEYFIVLADTLNFSKAAEKLHVSQSTFSKNIASFEKELGVKLFTRTTRKTELTQEGMDLRKKAEDYFFPFMDFCNHLKVSKESKSQIYIGVARTEKIPETFLEYIRKQNLSDSEYVYLVTRAEQYELAQGIKEKKYDLVISADPLFEKEEKLTGMPISDFDMRLFVSSFHALSKQKNLVPEDFFETRLFLSPSYCYDSSLPYYRLNEHHKAVKVINSPSDILSMIDSGIGGAILPGITDLSSYPNICSYPFEKERKFYHQYLVWRKEECSAGTLKMIEEYKEISGMA
jgi:DNA-binding transcriptional LysR family regulator